MDLWRVKNINNAWEGMKKALWYGIKEVITDLDAIRNEVACNIEVDEV